MKPENNNIDHSREQTFEREQVILRKSDISENNKNLIRNFQNYIIASGSGTYRASKLGYQLRNLAEVLKTEFNLATKEEILNLVVIINTANRLSKSLKNGQRVENRHPLSECTRADYRRCLKQFYKWLRDDDERLESDDRTIRSKTEKIYRYLEKEVHLNYSKEQIDPSRILSEEDIEKVVSSCRSIKEKAFIKFLHETGMRSGEILGLRIRNIELKKNIGVANCDGKTGRRAVQFTKSMAYLNQWLQLHPHKNNPDSLLWLGESSNRMSEPLIYRGAVKLVDRCFKRAGVTKKHNLHWFRHSRASLMAPHLPEALLCKYMGWVMGSKQVKTYLHLCPQQLEDAYLKMNGLSNGEEELKGLPQKCGCGMVNDSFARYCLQCGNPLNVSVAIQDQEIVKSEVDDRLKAYAEIMSDPVKKAKFEEFRKIFFGQGKCL